MTGYKALVTFNHDVVYYNVNTVCNSVAQKIFLSQPSNLGIHNYVSTKMHIIIVKNSCLFKMAL